FYITILSLRYLKNRTHGKRHQHLFLVNNLNGIYTTKKNSDISSRSVPPAAERNAEAYMCLWRSLNFLFIECPAEKK
ncbi:MAG: hypothetical protein ACK52I_03785, partial [Pseudomonadota bacterium]